MLISAQGPSSADPGPGPPEGPPLGARTKWDAGPSRQDTHPLWCENRRQKKPTCRTRPAESGAVWDRCQEHLSLRRRLQLSADSIEKLNPTASIPSRHGLRRCPLASRSRTGLDPVYAERKNPALQRGNGPLSRPRRLEFVLRPWQILHADNASKRLRHASGRTDSLDFCGRPAHLSLPAVSS